MEESRREAMAFDLTEQFLNAYEANDDGEQLSTLKRKLGISGPSVLAGILQWFADRVQCADRL